MQKINISIKTVKNEEKRKFNRNESSSLSSNTLPETEEKSDLCDKKEEELFKNESYEISKTNENEVFQKDFYHDDSVRIFNTIEDPYFMADDIAKYFGVKNHTKHHCKALLKLQEEEEKTSTTVKSKKYVGKITTLNLQNHKVPL